MLRRTCVRLRRVASRLTTRHARALATYLFVLPTLLAGVVYTSSYYAGDIRLIARFANDAQDTYSLLRADALRPLDDARPIVFLDFDELAFKAMGDPVLVPPEKLAEALNHLARKTPPWAVVVDVDVSYFDTAQAAPVAAALKDLAARGVTVLLVRPHVEDRPPRYRRAAIDTLVADERRIQWVSGSYLTSDDDQARRIRPVQWGSVGGGCLILPSVPLALLLLQRTGDGVAARETFERGSVGHCGKADGRTSFTFNYSPSAAFAVSNADDRIRYSLKWGSSVFQGISALGGARPQIQTPTIWTLISNPDQIATDQFADSLLFIGRSASGVDRHQTPLGEMPGAFILANAARAWLEFGPERPQFWPGFWLVISAAVLIGVAVAGVAKLFPRPPFFVKLVLPGLISGILWLLFYVFGPPGAAAGWAVAAYVVTAIVEAGRERVDHLRKTEKASS